MISYIRVYTYLYFFFLNFVQQKGEDSILSEVWDIHGALATGACHHLLYLYFYIFRYIKSKSQHHPHVGQIKKEKTELTKVVKGLERIICHKIGFWHMQYHMLHMTVLLKIQLLINHMKFY